MRPVSRIPLYTSLRSVLCFLVNPPSSPSSPIPHVVTLYKSSIETILSIPSTLSTTVPWEGPKLEPVNPTTTLVMVWTFVVSSRPISTPPHKICTTRTLQMSYTDQICRAENFSSRSQVRGYYGRRKKKSQTICRP